MTEQEIKDQDREIEKQAKLNRGHSLDQALLSEGGDFLSGGSPIPLVVQAQNEAKNWIGKNTSDINGSLIRTMEIIIDDKITLFGTNPDNALIVLKSIIEDLIKPSNLESFVRKVDVNYGQSMGERPIFQKLGDKDHPDDAYTISFVESKLKDWLAKF